MIGVASRLFEVRAGRRRHAFFGTKRFDRRPGNRRVHVHSLANLIQVNFRIPSSDYDHLVPALRLRTRNEPLGAARRLLANGLELAAHVRDDRAKNFAFLMNEKGD